MAGFTARASKIMDQYSIENITESEYVLRAMHKCENGVRWKASVQRFEINTLRWGASIQSSLRDGAYKEKKKNRFDVVERGKLRHIESLHISDRAAQKILCDNAIRPVMYPRLVYDNSAGQEGKGTDFAIKRLKEHLRWWYARHGKSGVIVLTDIHNYFGSIPRGKAAEALNAHFLDEHIRKYTSDIVGRGGRGLGLGSEINQIGAICYMDPVDRIVKEKYRVHCYGRFNDDGYFIVENRSMARAILADIQIEMDKLGVALNMKKTAMHNLASDDFVFLKKRVHIEDTGRIVFRIIRKNIRYERKRILAYRAEYDAGRMTREQIDKSYETWRSYAKKYNAYHTVGDMDRFFAGVMSGTSESSQTRSCLNC